VTRTDFISFTPEYQRQLCALLEREDGVGTFTTDEWVRNEGGGGRTKVLGNDSGSDEEKPVNVLKHRVYGS
jgi:coproporphyrinogen III oxidase